jgi:hypothetical protein
MKTMRAICLVLALLGVPAIAAAQQTVHVSAGAAKAPGSTGSTRSSGSMGSIGLPLPSIGLPLPAIGLPPRQPVGDLGQSGQRGGNGRGDGQRGGGERRDFRHRPGPAVVYLSPYPYYNPYYGPYYGTPSGQVTQATTVPGVITVVPEPPSGTLRLEVEPADILQVFVDGAYVGTPADLGNELNLPPGSRRIEFRAPGYRTLTIDAQIVSQRTIVYRAVLERLAPARVAPPPAAPIAPPAPEVPAVPSGNRTMYFIPGCYMGNVPPQDLKLPAGCDLSRLTTVKP